MPDPRAAAFDGPLLLLSPHLDDAALSCGALFERDEPFTVFDVFTQRPEPEQVTEWDTRCGFAGSNQAMNARWAEEHRAFAGSAHAFAAIDLLDGQYRDGPRDERDAARLERAIGAWLATMGGRAIVAMPVGAGTPRGLSTSFATRWKVRRRGTFAFGNSPDHLFVRDTAIAYLLDKPDVTIVLYEEYPYMFAMSGSRVVPAIERWAGRTAVEHVLRVDRHAKAERIAAYTSQLSLLFRSSAPDSLVRALPATERYWELSAP